MFESRARTAASYILLGAVLAGVAFGAAGGTQLGRTAITEVLLIVFSGGLVVAAVLFAPPGPLYGGTSLVAFGARRGHGLLDHLVDHAGPLLCRGRAHAG